MVVLARSDHTSFRLGSKLCAPHTSRRSWTARLASARRLALLPHCRELDGQHGLDARQVDVAAARHHLVRVRVGVGVRAR
eukprot:scaffold56532_cov55-Phaeocystis_antarctica.AAC.4